MNGFRAGGAIGPHNVKVVSWNLGGTDTWNRRCYVGCHDIPTAASRAADHIYAMDIMPDVIMWQEVTTRDAYDILRKKLCPLFPHWTAFPTIKREGFHGVVTCSRTPIKQSGFLAWPHDVVGNEPQGLVHILTQDGFIFVNVHLSLPMETEYVKTTEMTLLQQYIAKIENANVGKPVIVGGDFNNVHGWSMARKMEQMFRGSNTEHRHASLKSHAPDLTVNTESTWYWCGQAWAAKCFCSMKIDYTWLHCPGRYATAYKTEEQPIYIARVSDHMPLLTTFYFDSPTPTNSFCAHTHPPFAESPFLTMGRFDMSKRV